MARLPLRGIVSQNFKDVDKSSRYHFSWSNFKRENDLFQSNLSYVDPEFFEMFSFEFIKGDPKALKMLAVYSSTIKWPSGCLDQQRKHLEKR
jgi:hypothetical protein